MAKCVILCTGNSYCTTTAKCKCYPGYSGDTCKTVVNCPNNCTNSNQGVCTEQGLCNCMDAWGYLIRLTKHRGADCNLNKTGNMSMFNFTEKKNLVNHKDLLNIDQFGYLFYEQLRVEIGSKYYSKFQPADSCPDSCNFRGFCKSKRCYCKRGYIGSSCQYTHSSFKDSKHSRKKQSI